MSIKSIDVSTIAQICFVAVASQRQALSPETELQLWDEIDKEQQDKVTEYVCATLSGRPTPDTADGRMISRICHQFADPKKTLKYA
jgi:hypothetical protein